MYENDVRTMIYGTLIGFLLLLVFWISFVYLSACGFTLNCPQGEPRVVRTPIPTLIPRHTLPQTDPGLIDFSKCEVAATDLIGAWVSEGYPAAEPFPFTDVNGQTCEGSFEEDIRPLFVENSLWISGSIGCISCHNGALNERSAGLDLTSYDSILLGSRRVEGSTSAGTDVLGNGSWEGSILHQVLVNQSVGLTGHTGEPPAHELIIYAGERVTEVEVTPTP